MGVWNKKSQAIDMGQAIENVFSTCKMTENRVMSQLTSHDNVVG